jgi:hypothetical protein
MPSSGGLDKAPAMARLSRTMTPAAATRSFFSSSQGSGG